MTAERKAAPAAETALSVKSSLLPLSFSAALLGIKKRDRLGGLSSLVEAAVAAWW